MVLWCIVGCWTDSVVVMMVLVLKGHDKVNVNENYE